MAKAVGGAVVPRVCDSCSYARWAEEVEPAKRMSPGSIISGWPWYLLPFAIFLAPFYIAFLVLWLVLFPLRMIFLRRRVDKFHNGLRYEQFSRCPRCGSDQVRTVPADGFVPSAAGPTGPVQIGCPSCGTQNRVPASGRHRCGKCGSEFVATVNRR